MAAPAAMPSVVALAALFWIAQGTFATPVQMPMRLESQVAVCPSVSELRSALEQVLGGGPLSPDGWVLSYGRDPPVPAADRDASLWMVLADPYGERLVERHIPASLEECPAIAGAMAAVAERSLRTLGWTRGDPLPVSARTSDTQPTNLEPVQASKPAARLRLPRVVLGTGPLLGSSQRIGTNLLLEARVCAVGTLCVRLGSALLSRSVSQDTPSGTARMTSRYLTVALLAVFASRGVEWAGGPLLLVSYDHGSGELAQAGSGYRGTLAVGAGMAVALPLSRRWRFGVGLEALRSAAGPDFFVTIDGRKTLVLSPPAWEGMAAVRLEFLAWP